MQSKDGQVKLNDSSIPEEEGVNKEKEDVMDQGGVESGKGNEVEDTWNPLDQPMDTMPYVETQSPIDNEDPKKGKEEIDNEDKKVEMIDVVSEARDSVEDVKDFLEKDKHIFDDLALSHGPINLYTLSPIQNLKLASLA